MHRITLVFLVACTVGEDAHTDMLDLDSALLVSARDHLQVCLQVDPSLAAQTSALAAQLRADLLALRARHPDWHVAGLDRGELDVVVGCPASAMPLAAIDPKGIDGAVIGPGLRSAPSRSRTHVYVITDAAAAPMLGDRPYARAIAELAAVDDHRVAEVSTALIIRASALGTPGFRDVALPDGLGLRALP